MYSPQQKSVCFFPARSFIGTQHHCSDEGKHQLAPKRRIHTDKVLGCVASFLTARLYFKPQARRACKISSSARGARNHTHSAGSSDPHFQTHTHIGGKNALVAIPPPGFCEAVQKLARSSFFDISGWEGFLQGEGGRLYFTCFRGIFFFSRGLQILM